jgi:hypothetical protein
MRRGAGVDVGGNLVAEVAVRRPVAEIRMSENCRYTPHYGPADQLIRWAKFTMNPSGPRTDAMRQMPSY